MPKTFSNWSGSVTFTPKHVERPRDEVGVARVIERAANQQRNVRVVGSLHSSSGIIEADDILLSLERMKGIESHDPDAHQATLRPGTTLDEAGKALRRIGLAMPNLGDVDVQAVAGAIATGTHGSGHKLQNLAGMLIGGRLVDGTGRSVEFSAESDPELVCAARVSLGAIGVLTALRLKLEPAYKLRRQEWCASTDDCLADLDRLIAENRNFDFYWYPRRDDVKIRTHNPPEEPPRDLPYAKLLVDYVGWSDEVLSKHRELRFEEMEYALPAEAGPACFREVRRRMLDRHRQHVAWRTLYRTTAADDAYLSNAHGRPTVNISLHQNASLPYWDFFHDLEPVFREHGGRPHWAKKHTLKAAELQPLYPAWDRYQQVRRRCDPEGMFMTQRMRELLGE